LGRRSPFILFWENRRVEITWYGVTCVRLRGREGVVAVDAYRSIVGPTGRGLSADIVAYSHADPHPEVPRGRRGARPAPNGHVTLPTSLQDAFALEVPGEFEVHDVLITGVRTYRDEAKGSLNGPNVAFVFELDGLHAVHLGDIGHVLSEGMLGEIGTVDVVCVPIGGHLSAARAAELVAQLDANLVVPLPVCEEEADCDRELARFLHEMGVGQAPEPQAKLTVTPSSVPQELTLIRLESRSKT
jgi:L-ascorbate metabolism protein UlaG (beta-lactamase superfamily)